MSTRHAHKHGEYEPDLCFIKIVRQEWTGHRE